MKGIVTSVSFPSIPIESFCSESGLLRRTDKNKIYSLEIRAKPCNNSQSPLSDHEAALAEHSMIYWLYERTLLSLQHFCCYSRKTNGYCFCNERNTPLECCNYCRCDIVIDNSHKETRTLFESLGQLTIEKSLKYKI